MKILIIYLFCLNLIDGFLTYYGLFHSYIEEGNPIMSYLYNFDPLIFLAVKIAFSLCLICFLYSERILSNLFIKRLMSFASVIYTFILFLHGDWIVALIVNA